LNLVSLSKVKFLVYCEMCECTYNFIQSKNRVGGHRPLSRPLPSRSPHPTPSAPVAPRSSRLRHSTLLPFVNPGSATGHLRSGLQTITQIWLTPKQRIGSDPASGNTRSIRFPVPTAAVIYIYTTVSCCYHNAAFGRVSRLLFTHLNHESGTTLVMRARASACDWHAHPPRSTSAPRFARAAS